MDSDTFDYFKSVANMFYKKYINLKGVILSISDCLSKQKNVTEEIFLEMLDVFNVKERIYRYQDYSIQKNFLRGREAMEERTLNNVANAYAEFAMVNKRRILRLATENETADENRYELYKLITDALLVRQEIAEMARENITVLIDAFITGDPIFNYKFEDLPRAHNQYIVPRKLMNFSMHHNHYMLKYVPKLNTSDFDLMHSVLDMFIEQATIAYENRTVNESRLDYVFERFQFACRTYMFSKSVVDTQGIELPSRVIQERLSNFRSEWTSFDSDIINLRQNMDSLTTLLRNVTLNILPSLEYIIYQISNYTELQNGKLMHLANVFLSNETRLLINILKNFFQEVQTRGQQIQDSTTLLMKPVENMWTMIILDEDSIDYYNYTDNLLFLRNMSLVLEEWNDKIDKLKQLDVRRHVFNKDEEFFVANDEITLHLEEFKNSIVVDGEFVK